MIQHYLSSEALRAFNAIPASFWYWAWVGVIALGSILTLWVLSLIKNVAGWFGVVLVLLLLLYGYGWGRGWVHASLNPLSEPFHIAQVIK